jgi:hypothetical protein
MEFFTNPATREYGFTDEFWQEAYDKYRRDLELGMETNPRWGDEMEKERTVRVSLQGRDYDVLVRTPPEDSREFPTLRLSAFPASPEPEPPQMSRIYWYNEENQKIDLQPIGEAVLPDEFNEW